MFDELITILHGELHKSFIRQNIIRNIMYIVHFLAGTFSIYEHKQYSSATFINYFSLNMVCRVDSSSSPLM